MLIGFWGTGPWSCISGVKCFNWNHRHWSWNVRTPSNRFVWNVVTPGNTYFQTFLRWRVGHCQWLQSCPVKMYWSNLRQVIPMARNEVLDSIPVKPTLKVLNPFIPKIETFILLTSTINFFVGYLWDFGVIQCTKITPLYVIIIFILNICLTDISLKLWGEFTC